MLIANLVRWLLAGRRLEWLLALLAFIACMLPDRLLSPWTADVSRVVSVPLAQEHARVRPRFSSSNARQSSTERCTLRRSSRTNASSGRSLRLAR